LDLTAVTVRHHLDILRSEGLIAAPTIHRRKTPGRPQYVYSLTDKASLLFPKRYGRLASLVLDEMRSYLSPAEVSELLERIGERIAGEAAIPETGGFETRLTAAVEFLNGLGYMARWERRGDGQYLLHIANCIYEEVADRDHEICTVDQALLSRLLGTPPRRISWAVQDGDQCVYAVRPPDG